MELRQSSLLVGMVVSAGDMAGAVPASGGSGAILPERLPPLPPLLLLSPLLPALLSALFLRRQAQSVCALAVFSPRLSTMTSASL